MVYSVSYDLRKPGRNYDALYAYLQKFTWCHALESTWFVMSDLSAANIRDAIGKLVDAGDGVVVTRLAADWATWGMSAGVNAWLRAHLS